METPFFRYEMEIEDTIFYTTVLKPWMERAKVGDVCPHLMPNGMKLVRANDADVTFCDCCGPEVFEWSMIEGS